MICFINTREFQIDEPTVVTIGKFDGRHKGHQKLLGEMKKIREQYSFQTAVFTFHTPPGTFTGGEVQKVITTNEERIHNMENMGIDYLVEYPFTQEVARMSPEEFVKHILLEQMKADAIVVGTDCGFGYRRAGNAELLKRLSSEYGYRLTIIEKEQEDNRDISSTYIKEQLSLGHMEKANELLGEPFSIHGQVVHGNHIGGTILGFPTVNLLPPPEKYLPLFGVYVSQVMINGICYGGITNIGRKPTVGGESPVGVETFIFGLNQDLYGEEIEVQLLHFLRREKKFDSLEILKQQLEKDKAYGLKYLEGR